MVLQHICRAQRALALARRASRGKHIAVMWRIPPKREEGEPIFDIHRLCQCGGRRSRESRKFFLGPAWLRRALFTSVILCGSKSNSLDSPCRAMLAGPRKTLERALGTPAGAIIWSRPNGSSGPTSAFLGAEKSSEIALGTPDERVFGLIERQSRPRGCHSIGTARESSTILR